MKKLNRKGFTLIELLATVVILSLVTGVAVPVTTNIVSTSEYKALGTFVDEAEDFITDQWKIKKIDPDTMTEAFKTVMNDYKISSDENNPKWVSLNVSNDVHKTLIEEMGIPSEDVTTVDIMIDTDNIPCVVISSIPTDSGIYNSKYWDKISPEGTTVVIPLENNLRYYSKCCIKEKVQQLITNKYKEGE